jgi:hydroxymethylpyrimidine/phosphomethylpyrimidine kinase
MKIEGSMPTALTIAGSDSGGGAGIQADLKTFAALGVYGTTAITAITAQNTREVTAIFELPPEIVVAQIESIVTDIGANAVKTGMMRSARLVDAVAVVLERLKLPNLVVDPVMISKSGAPLLEPDGVESLRLRLLPLARVITPNLPEAEALIGRRLPETRDRQDAAREIVAMGAGSVVIKGGHLGGEPVDLFFDGQDFTEFPGARIRTTSDHGTGCTFSAAIAALLARDIELKAAVGEAKRFVEGAMRAAPRLGSGHGPLDHFFGLKSIGR